MKDITIDEIKEATAGSFESRFSEKYPDAPEWAVTLAANVAENTERTKEHLRREKEGGKPAWAQQIEQRVEETTQKIETVANANQ